MLSRRRAASVCLLALGSAALVFVFMSRDAPRQGCALTPSARAFALLKNRDAQPSAHDFDPRATLDALTAPGDDRARWEESRAAVVEGYVIKVSNGGVEAANCYSLTRRDIHIHVAASAAAPLTGSLIVEVTPRTAEAAGRRGMDWSLDALRRELVGRRCRFEGWLLYDREHADESVNTAPGNPVDWRATAWELHPVTRIEVLK